MDQKTREEEGVSSQRSARKFNSEIKVSELIYLLSHKSDSHVDEAWPLKLVY